MVGRPGPVVVQDVEQPADPAQRRDYGAPARLGGVRGEHQVHAQPGEQFGQVAGPAVVSDFGHRGGKRFSHRRLPGIALPQDADALVLFGQVGQVKVDGEGAGHLLGLVQAPRPDQRHDLVPGRITGHRITGHRITGHRPRVGRAPGVALAVPGLDHRAPQPLHVGQQLRPGGVGDNLAEDVAEQPDIAPHRLRQRGTVPVSIPVHGQSLIAQTDLPTSLMSMTTQAAAEPGGDHEPVPAPHTTAGKIADLERRRSEAVHAGSAQAVAKQHERGKLTARERIELLLDPGSFTEFDELARHRATDFGIAATRPYGDGVVTGYGTVDGRPVCVFSQDFTVFGGSLGEVYGEKIVKIMDHALKTGCPMIGINDGGGARIQEGVVALGLFAEIFYRNVMASGVIPQISLIMGPCAGGAVYSPAITDFTLMVEGTSHMFITGPDVIKTVTGEDVTFEELGGAHAHGVKSGVAHYQAKDEQDCIDFARDLLSYLPSNNLDDPPRHEVPESDGAEPDEFDAELDTLIPDSPNQPYDMHEVFTHVLDDGEFLEVHAGFAPNMVVGFGRIEGSSVGVVANQPMHYAGCLDIDASEKAARFVRTCDAFSIPILTFVDVPGFLPGVTQEWSGIIRRGAKLIYAYAEATVPKVTVITRKAYGGAYDVMGSKHLGGDVNLAWPTAQIAVMGAQGAVNILYRRELATAPDPDALRAQKITEYEDTLANPYIAAERGYVDNVIRPAETRLAITRALRSLRSKRQTLPPKKHGNIPL